MRRAVLYVDVDDTIARSTGKRNFPRSEIIARLQNLSRNPRIELYLWSSGGAEYAKTVAEQFGVSKLFQAFLPKPTILVDDAQVETWRYLRQLHPNDILSGALDDLLDEDDGNG